MQADKDNPGIKAGWSIGAFGKKLTPIIGLITLSGGCMLIGAGGVVVGMHHNMQRTANDTRALVLNLYENGHIPKETFEQTCEAFQNLATTGALIDAPIVSPGLSTNPLATEEEIQNAIAFFVYLYDTYPESGVDCLGNFSGLDWGNVRGKESEIDT
jgi:hypothetical protein